VKVARKGARVMYRRGYYARAQLVPYDRRQFMTFSRILSATAFPENIDDIELNLEARMTPVAQAVRPAAGDDGSAEVSVRGTIDAEKIALGEENGLHTGRVEVALFALDRKNRLVGERWLTVDLSLDGRERDAALREGIRFESAVPVRDDATKVKIVIYDFDADAVGSRTIPVRR
jgi:hypothetical protein